MNCGEIDLQDFLDLFFLDNPNWAKALGSGIWASTVELRDANYQEAQEL